MSSLEDGRKVFVTGLSWQTNEDTLGRAFSEFGEIKEILLVKDKITHRPRGFGFVTFYEIEAARSAVSASSSITLDGRTLVVKKALSKAEVEPPRRELGPPNGYGRPTKKIFIGSLLPSIRESEVRHYFSQFGDVDVVEIPLDKETLGGRGFGFVTFHSETSVDFALTKEHRLGGQVLAVKRAEPKRDFHNVRGPSSSYSYDSSPYPYYNSHSSYDSYPSYGYGYSSSSSGHSSGYSSGYSSGPSSSYDYDESSSYYSEPRGSYSRGSAPSRYSSGSGSYSSYGYGDSNDGGPPARSSRYHPYR